VATYYTLDADGQPVPCDDVIAWSLWFETADRHVAQDADEATGVRVSTVFLGLDHQWKHGAPPLLWETLIFGGARDGETYRYSSRAAALDGHRAICRELAC
jgi:hypothetical protein